MPDPISLSVGGGSNAFKVTYDVKKGMATIQYGVMNINSYFVDSGGAIGSSQTISAITQSYVYLQINGIFDRNNTPTISFINTTDSPFEAINHKLIEVPAKPFPSLICLAFINDKGTVTDLRPAYIVNVFSFLG